MPSFCNIPYLLESNIQDSVLLLKITITEIRDCLKAQVKFFNSSDETIMDWTDIAYIQNLETSTSLVLNSEVAYVEFRLFYCCDVPPTDDPDLPCQVIPDNVQIETVCGTVPVTVINPYVRSSDTDEVSGSFNPVMIPRQVSLNISHNLDTCDVSANLCVYRCIVPSPTPTVTPTSTVTPTITNSPSPTQTPPPSFSPTPTVTRTLTPTPTITPTITNTPTITKSPGASPTPTPSFTPTSSLTPTPTPTLTPSKPGVGNPPRLPGADYLVFSYTMLPGAGRDLDTETYISYPFRSKTLGYCPSNSGGQGEDDAPYFYWSGDNTGLDGNEEVLVDLKAIKTNYEVNKVSLVTKANWYAGRLNGNVRITMYAYKGGIMTTDPQDRYSFINIGGTLLGSHNFPIIDVTAYNYTCSSTTCLGTYTYTFSNGQFTRESICPSETTPVPTRSPLPTPTPIYCCEPSQTCSFSPAISANTLGTINMGSTIRGSNIDVDKIECSIDVINLMYRDPQLFDRLLVNPYNGADPTRQPDFNSYIHYTKYKIYYIKKSHPDGRVFPVVNAIAYRTDSLPIDSLINIIDFNNYTTTDVRNWIKTQFKFAIFRNNSNNVMQYVRDLPFTNIIWKPGNFIKPSITFNPDPQTVYVLLSPY